MGRISIRVCDVFDVAVHEDDYIVISTNVGWKSDGCNVMGRGIAKTAALRYPRLPKLYGDWCKECGPLIYVNDDFRIICAPSKELNYEKPWLSWNAQSSPDLILRSYSQTLVWAKLHPKKRLFHVVLGASNGGIPIEDALELAERFDWPINVQFVKI